MVALAGFGSVVGAWTADAASVAQALLVLGLSVALVRGRRKERRASGSPEPQRPLADIAERPAL
jgi:hypothetical protein